MRRGRWARGACPGTHRQAVVAGPEVGVARRTAPGGRSASAGGRPVAATPLEATAARRHKTVPSATRWWTCRRAVLAASRVRAEARPAVAGDRLERAER